MFTEVVFNGERMVILGGGKFNGGRMVITEAASLIEGACYIRGQFNEERMVILRRYPV